MPKAKKIGRFCKACDLLWEKNIDFQFNYFQSLVNIMSKVEIVNLFSHLHENQTNKKTTENKNGYAQIKSNSKLFFLFIKKKQKKKL